ncbi:MAG TPA: arylsulfatase [Planctomycetota bacterium]|nr:arylsulfatase [Planctomycetota bacterium]
MSRLLPLALVLAGACAGGGRAPAGRPPNIVFILADDLGYAELGSYGQSKIATPHLDRLAREGMRFTQAYAGSAVCAPSRCVLMTGRHAGRAYTRNNGNPPDRLPARPQDGHFPGQTPIPEGEITIAETLKAAGYATAAAGKWGLGYEGSSGDPLRQGFDHFYGYLCQGHAHNHYPAFLWRDGRKEPLEGNVHGPTGRTHSQEKFTEEALRVVEANRDRPFFLYLPVVIPHVSIQVPEPELARYAGRFPEEDYQDRSNYHRHPTPRAAYAAMVSYMDRAVGTILDRLRALGLEENTYVFFTSDNGPTHGRVGGADSAFFGSAGPFRGLKGSLFEGGIRVPFIVRGPGVRAGTVSDAPIAFYDVLPTLADLAGARAPDGLDGLSFAPLLRGGSAPRHDFLYWEFPGYGGWQAVRMGDWKGVRRDILQKGNRDPLRIELYDLAKDPGETTDVAAANPDVVRKIAEIMKREHVPSALFAMPPIDLLSK